MTPLTERYALYLLIASITVMLVAVRWLTWHYGDLYARKVDALCKANAKHVDVEWFEEYVHTREYSTGVYSLTLHPFARYHREVYVDGLRLSEDVDFTFQPLTNTITITSDAFRSAFQRKHRLDGGATIMRVLVGYWVLSEHKHKMRMKVQASDNAQTVTGVTDHTAHGGVLHSKDRVKEVFERTGQHKDGLSAGVTFDNPDNKTTTYTWAYSQPAAWEDPPTLRDTGFADPPSLR